MMASSALRILVPGLLLPTLRAHAGGWAVITVQDLPDYVEAGKRVDLSYMVRQHGQTPLDQLRGNIEATSGRLSATGTVLRARSQGCTQPRSRSPAPVIGPSRSAAASAAATSRSFHWRRRHGTGLTRPVTDVERGRHFRREGVRPVTNRSRSVQSSKASASMSRTSGLPREPAVHAVAWRQFPCRTSDSSSAKLHRSSRS